MNLLSRETSPYLLQHADNPVHWRPWGPEALEAARAQNKPILLSSGYAACHWCHVMAHESFEDEITAAEMNARYICIKLDREERPDIDALYMNALHLLGEQGGWPLTMFLTPAGEPFWGGTYFPPEPRWGRPSFRQVLGGIAQAWAEGSDKVAQNTRALKQALDRMAAANPGPLPGPAAHDAVARQLLKSQDPVEGGFQGAPKFPNPPIYRYLWQVGGHVGAAELMLRRMALGGIHDHLGGGFARYAVDEHWLVPHFEKMLYDNGQLLELFALAQARRAEPLWREAAEGIVGWLARDMLAEGRAFAAAEDADSEGVEGKFYVWSLAEIEAVLGADAAFFAEHYDVTADGNWEHHNILNRSKGRRLDEAGEARLAGLRGKLLAARAPRIRPARDDKILADWNGMMIAGLARASAVFGHPEWLDLAEAAFRFVTTTMQGPDHRLHHAWRLGRPSAPGLLEDYAQMARAALALFQHRGDPALLDQAIAWMRVLEADFAAPEGGFFTSPTTATDVLVRGFTAGDNATPAGNGIAAEVAALLYHATADEHWRSVAEGTIGAFSGLEAGLAAMPSLLAAADLLERGATVVIAGPPEHPGALALRQAALTLPDPAVLVLCAPTPDALPPGHPAHGKPMQDGAPAAYICRAGRCGLPVTDAAALQAPA
ncbi:thioredoxin domain-containing protein [Rhodovarius crocodyli]|uniref:Thioredoxin domain-containing protein n=1 Tax=Rhodovarius crocodyli TaxID=1979269 RepID=A0A437MPD0_9PROT|nr:thioredoxin domain-containing protein [Rhodovarius crocodyli]RVT99488.1 thioredoxin domain-containing protein [Rhodovarius crocodyli]